jgi:uncharacterized protein with HEPN domain
MSRHDDRTYLRHMLDHARTALDLASGKPCSSLDTEPVLRYALLHLICIVGEAAGRVSPAGRAKYAQLPWRDIVGMRNMLVHGYDVVDLDILWKTIEEDLPALHSMLDSIIENEDES